MTTVTPIRQSALQHLQNAVQIADVYADPSIAASSAQEQLPRIRGLIMVALAKLGEPNQAAIEAAHTFTAGGPPPGDLRYARDAAAVVLHAALTGEVAGESWVHALPCPDCDGAAIIKGFPCERCRGTGMST